MRTVVIIGNSAAGTAVAQALREGDKDARVTIVTDEPFLGYDRRRVLEFLDGKIKERDLAFRGKDFYADLGIELLTGRKVIEICVHRKRVSFKDADPLEFDYLVIASGKREALPELKGIQKEGVMGLNGLVETKHIMERLPICHTVLIAGGGPVANALARILASRKIDVKFFGSLDPAIEGVEVINDNPILEVLGDSEIKAVRLSNHKVVGASLLIFAGDRKPHMPFLRDTDIKVNKGVLVDASLKTNIPHIFAAGAVAEPQEGAWQEGWDESLRQGRMLGGLLCQI